MSKLFEHPYASFLDEVSKPTRYTGSEHGVRRKDWGSVQARICLAFPDIYDIGMSHLGYRLLYKILNDHEQVLAERCYAPWTDMVAKLHEHGEFLRSLENQRPLCDFDVVGFSLQYELTYTNVLLMLDLSGIPLRSASRSDDDPLIIAGGPVATHAEPMALFFDAIAVGDGEELLLEVALSWTESKRRQLSRRERLERLAQIPGVYVPSLYLTDIDPQTQLEVVVGRTTDAAPLPIERRLLDDINRFPFPDDGPVGGPEAIFDRMSIEVARGCTEGCRFCQAGMIYRPVRERDPQQVLDTVQRALERSGQDEVSLTALSTADVSCISPLIQRLVERTAPERVSLSVASLRAYGLAEHLLDDMRRVRAAGLTFAPEAGTQRMRDVINKNVTEEQLLETAERVFSRGFDKMKLYFMIGLPTETDEDVLGIVHVGKNALSVGRRLAKGRARVTVSVSTHVPKPHTPFQWCAMDSVPEIGRKQQLLREAARGNKHLGLKTHYSITSVLEGVLARGDRRLGLAIERAYQGGAIFDSWEECLRMDCWQEAFEHFEIDQQRYLGTLPVTGRLPWDHVDIGLEDGFLLREYRRALANRLSPPCGKAKGMFVHHTNTLDARQDARRLVCYDCGIACDLGQMRDERVRYLSQLGAEEPNQRARLPLLERGPAPSSAARDPEALRPRRAGGEPQRWRLRFEKTGPMALLGHLDLLRELPRVIRRAGCRTHYTRGFHPKPELALGPALSLGVASLDEYADVSLIDPPPFELLLERLNAAAPGGLRFTAARRMAPKTPSISAGIVGAEYLLAFARSALPHLPIPLDVAAAAFMARTECTILRRIKGIGKKIDVRNFVEYLELAPHAHANEQLARAGLVGDLVALSVRVRISAQGAVKTSELVEALFGAAVEHRAVRTRLLAAGGSPLDAAAARGTPRFDSASATAGQ